MNPYQETAKKIGCDRCVHADQEAIKKGGAWCGFRNPAGMALMIIKEYKCSARKEVNPK